VITIKYRLCTVQYKHREIWQGRRMCGGIIFFSLVGTTSGKIV